MFYLSMIPKTRPTQQHRDAPPPNRGPRLPGAQSRRRTNEDKNEEIIGGSAQEGMRVETLLGKRTLRSGEATSGRMPITGRSRWRKRTGGGKEGDSGRGRALEEVCAVEKPRGEDSGSRGCKKRRSGRRARKMAVCGAGNACERLTCNSAAGWGSRGSAEGEEGRTVAALLIAEM